MADVLRKLFGALWAVLQLLMPWLFGTPSSKYPVRSRPRRAKGARRQR